MLPDPGSYEERYSLTGAALSLAAALLSVSLGLLWHTHLIFAALTSCSRSRPCSRRPAARSRVVR